MRLIAFIAVGTQIRTTLFHGEPVTRAGNPGFPRNLKPVPGCDTAARVLERPLSVNSNEKIEKIMGGWRFGSRIQELIKEGTIPMVGAELVSQRRIDELESIRGIAALLVVLFHVPKWNSVLDVALINNASLMVDVFFVLSGFVICQNYYAKINSVKDVVVFQLLRFWRLFPVHLLFLLLFLLVEIAKYLAIKLFGVGDIKAIPFHDNSGMAFLQQLLLIHAIGQTGNSLTFNFPAWSISVEFYTYILFAVGLLMCRFRSGYFFLLMASGSILVLYSSLFPGFRDVLHCCAGFFSGCIAARVANRYVIYLRPMVSLIILLLVALFLGFYEPGRSELLIYFLTFTLILSLVYCRDGWLNYVLRLKALTWLGGISYSIYMCHALVLLTLEVIYTRILLRPKVANSAGDFILSLSGLETLIAVLIYVVVVLIVGQLVSVLIERPMREWSRQKLCRYQRM